MDCDYFVIVLYHRLRHSKVILSLWNDQHLCAIFPIYTLITLFINGGSMYAYPNCFV